MSARDAAIAYVTAHAETDSYPALDPAEVSDIVDEYGLAASWVTGTTYGYGDLVIPSVFKGRIFQNVGPGTSGGTEPNWDAVLSNQPGWASYVGDLYQGQIDLSPGVVGTLSDGTAYWREYASGVTLTYDTRGAVRAAWLKKAGKVAGKYDFSADGQSFQRSQAYDHCMEQARAYVSVVIV